MKVRWIPLLATVSCLALAAVAPAQRGRGGGGDGGGRSSGSSGGGRSSGGSSRSGGDNRPSRSSGSDSRSSRSGDSRPSRSGGDRPSRSDSRSSRDDRSSSPFGRTSDDRGSRGRSDERDYHGERHSLFDYSRDDRGSRPSGSVGTSGSRRYEGGYGYVRPGRTGSSFTGGFHNGYGSVSPARYGGGYSHSVLGVQIERNRPHVGYNGDYRYGGVYGGLRYGYVGYGGYYDYFGYPFYAYDPWGLGVVASPWYSYSFLPPYVDTSHVTIVNDYRSPYDGVDWRDVDRDSRSEALDDTLGDIRDAFERNSDRYAERLLPETGQVAIFNQGKYDYSIGAEDFKDMYLDGIEQSKTIRYEITESKVRGDEVHLRARHQYTDSFGAEQTVYHTYTLRRERGRYVIREFGTD